MKVTLRGGKLMRPVEFPCSGCGAILEATSDMTGDRVNCPDCKREMIVPDVSIYAAPTAGAELLPVLQQIAASAAKTEDFVRQIRNVIAALIILGGLLGVFIGAMEGASATHRRATLQIQRGY